MTIGVIVVVMLFGGMISAAVASSRGIHPAVGFFIIGAMIPILGIILAAVAQPSAPAGMQAVKCPQCNAKQNIDAGAVAWQCWQCRADWHLPSALPG